jgi:sugar (pentulose or hexulose) kinase
MYLLALDQSTSATKAILFDARGKVLDRASRASQTDLSPARLGGT